MSNSVADGVHEFSNPKLIGQFSSGGYGTSAVNILAAAFYNIELSSLQNALLYQTIMNI